MKNERTQPQAVEFEELVLGAIILENRYDAVTGMLTPNHFYKAENSMVFSAIEDLIKNNQSCIKRSAITKYRVMNVCS